MTNPSERSRAVGGIVIAGLLLAVGIVYLTQTLAAGNSVMVSLYPLACVSLLLGLVVIDIVAALIRWRRAATSVPLRDGGPAEQADPSTAAEGAEAEVADPEAEGAAPTRWSVFAPLLLGTIVFAFVALNVDYLIGTVAFVYAAIWWLDRRRFNWWKTLIIAIASAVAVHLLFVTVLHLRLPTVIPGL